MKAHDIKEQFPQNVLVKPVILKFAEQKIETSLEELLKVETWFDLENFQNKLKYKKEITKADLIRSNILIDEQIWKSLGFIEHSIFCCICLEGPKNGQIYIFSTCSHYICEECVDGYMKSRNIEMKGKIHQNNYLEYELKNGAIFLSLPCPSCKVESIAKDFIKLIKIYI